MAIKVGGTTVINDSREIRNATDIAGKYDDFFPNTSTITTQLDFSKPLMTLNMTGGVTFTATEFLAGRLSTLILDTSASAHTPTFPGSIEFSPSAPTWSTYRYWTISFVCISGSAARAFANGFSA